MCPCARVCVCVASSRILVRILVRILHPQLRMRAATAVATTALRPS